MNDDASQKAPADLVDLADPASVLVALEAPLRRFVASRGLGAHQIDDVVQETMARMLEVAPRLEVEALAAYAFTVARNLIHSGARSEATARRNLPRLLDRHEPSRPDTVATDAEARRALGAALAKLNPTVRAQLISRDLDRRPLHEVAAESNVSSGVLASQLHRTRARLRVDYLLALRNVALPTPACEKVLVAISAADHRRQASLGAGTHLEHCTVCSELSLPLVTRDHALAGWAPLPLLALGGLHGRLARWTAAHPRGTQATQVGAAAGVAVAGVAAVAVAAAVVLGGPSRVSPPTVAAPPPRTQDSRPSAPAAEPAVPGLSVDGGPVIAEPQELAALTARRVKGRDVRVLSVPADEGFWVGNDNARMWVQLSSHGESAVTVRAGQQLSFSAVMTPNTDDFLRRQAPAEDKGRSTLRRLGAHLVVDPTSLHVR